MVAPAGLERFGGVALGDRLPGWVTYGNTGGSCMMTGTVVYIHPEGRFFTLRFDFERGSFRQSYMIRGRIGGGAWGVEPATNVFRSPPAGWIGRQTSKQEDTP